MDRELDNLMAALSDPTRRRILERVAEAEPLATHELTASFPLTRWTVMKHLGVLRAAGLVQTLPQGRRRLHYIDRRRLAAAREWIERFS
jgi:DNA-binding transcriptional ArsR family regulator